MESLLGLSKEQAQFKITRQKRRGRFFWALGLVLLIIQITVATRAYRVKSAPQDETSRLTATSGARAAQFSPQVTASFTPAVTRTATTTPSFTPAATNTTMPVGQLPTATSTPSPAQAIDADRTTNSPGTGFGIRNATPTSSQADPQLTLSALPEQVTEQIFELAGTGPPQKTVFILYNHSIIAQASIDEHGYWQATIPTAPLARGDNTFTLSTTASGISGSSGDNQRVHFTTAFVPWWLDVPARLQASLGEGYACAPTVLGMAMDYYHQLDSSYPAPATTRLVQSLTQKGFIAGYGADAQMVCDLAIAYGYSHSFFYQEWSQAHLRQALDAGHPVIANVRVGLSTDGYGHSVLVIGLSHDGQRIMLIDPTQGLVESSWARFDRSWASFGPPYRHGTVIKP